MVNSGTEANEAAIKFARKYHHALAKEDGGSAPGASELIAFTSGFHGRTLGALSLTSKVQYRTPFEPLIPGMPNMWFARCTSLGLDYSPASLQLVPLFDEVWVLMVVHFCSV